MNTENTCIKLPSDSSSQNKILNSDFNETNKFFILDKMTHSVSGMGFECKKEKITLKTYRDFFRRDSFETKSEVLKVSKEECFYMKTTNICVDTYMSCENNICATNKSPLEIYTWLQEVSNEVINCEVSNRFITADDENSILFNNHLCIAKLGVCQFARSTVVWSMVIIHKCNFYLVEIVDAEIHSDDILIAFHEKLLFSAIKIENVNVCENIKLVSTSEGLFFTQDVKVLKFPKYDREITDLSKFMLSDTDLNRYKMSNAAKKLNFDVCINSLNLLNF